MGVMTTVWLLVLEHLRHHQQTGVRSPHGWGDRCCSDGVPGSSAVFAGGVIAYSSRSSNDSLGSRPSCWSVMVLCLMRW